MTEIWIQCNVLVLKNISNKFMNILIIKKIHSKILSKSTGKPKEIGFKIKSIRKNNLQLHSFYEKRIKSSCNI